MNDINFNCPECGQSLEVDAGSAGMAVACPECGRTILAPRLARLAEPLSFPETPARARAWWPAVLGVILLLLVAGGALIWERHGRPTAASVPVLPGNVTNNLVLYFSFDSAPRAGMVSDLSGHGNNGEATNVQWIADGHRGGALVLSPNDSHIRVSNNESLNPAQFTLCAWIKTSRTGHHWRRIFDKGLFHHDFALSVAGDWNHWHPPSKFRGFIEFELPKSGETSSGRPLADGQWHQIVATYDGENKRLFVDGRLQDETHCSDVSLGNDLDLVIGGFTDPDPKHDDPHASFDGSLDDVMLYDCALSPDEVAALYNSQKTASDKSIDP